ncbi:MAG: tyrosine-protein phosphatase [Eubacterium sp.]
MLINSLVETHCHILPGVDDGSPDIETSLKMIKKLQMQGAQTIILTPHYYSDSISLDDFLERRDNAFSQLKSALPEGSPKLIPAAEVYISQYLFSNENLERIAIGNSGYALIEHPFSSTFSQGTYDRLMNLNYEFKIKPILAHIERYQALMDNEDLLDEYIEMGCLVQVNISSFTDAPRHIRKKLFKYLETGRIHLIGSDCHNLSSRAPEYEKGVNEIIKKCGREAIDILEKNANLLVETSM